jgi:uncharacterized protein (TIGR02284 family)
MEKYTELINVLNDLIRINIDRARELKKRINDLENNDEYKLLFKRLINESNEFRRQLVLEIKKKGGPVITKVSSNYGKIYNSWKELKNWLLQKKDLSILEIIQFNTKATLKVYKEALFVVADIPADTLDLIATQKAHLRANCERIETELMLINPRTNSPEENYFNTKSASY